MPTTDEAVDFLLQYGSLRPPEESPWRTLEKDDEASRMDWNRLWRDEWEFPFLAQDEEELARAFEVGPPPDLADLPNNSEKGAHWDTCAWYQPVHFFGHNWGIFIKESCVRRTALMIARFVEPGGGDGIQMAAVFRDLYRAAVLVYFLHEHYHHKIECLGFRLHVVFGRSCYLPYKDAVYGVTWGTDDNLEEALANADSYLRLNQDPYRNNLPPYIRRAARAYLQWEFGNCSAPGYRMAVNYLTEAAFNAGENRLQGQVKEANLAPIQPPNEWDLCPRMAHPFFNVKSSIWTVVPMGGVPCLPTFP